jgi:DNA primase large subunit
MAYVPQSMQISLVLQEFSARLEKALEVCQISLFPMCCLLRCVDNIELQPLVPCARSLTIQLTARNLPRLDEDERLGPVIDHLAASFLSGLAGSDYHSPEGGADGVKVTAEMVDDIARKHFPACMLNLYSRLKRDKHMKHFGRLQLTLFLKVSADLL